MDKIGEELNYDFNYLTTCIRKFLPNISDPKDRQLILLWQEKLTHCGRSSLREARLRNDFLYYLCRCCADGQLALPFTNSPPKGKLLNSQHLLPNESVSTAKKARVTSPGTTTTQGSSSIPLPEIFDKSPDKGAFLISQPVPRCGAFCYLAIVNRAPPNQ